METEAVFYSETSGTTYDMPEIQIFAFVITPYNAALGSDPWRFGVQNTRLCACGFEQILTRTRMGIIFSVWSPLSSADFKTMCEYIKDELQDIL
jgi:hypothetical protein